MRAPLLALSCSLGAILALQSPVQAQAADKLRWLEAALQAARAIHDGSVNSALPALHSALAQCHEGLDHAGRDELRQIAVVRLPVEPRLWRRHHVQEVVVPAWCRGLGQPRLFTEPVDVTPPLRSFPDDLGAEVRTDHIEIDRRRVLELLLDPVD